MDLEKYLKELSEYIEFYRADLDAISEDDNNYSHAQGIVNGLEVSMMLLAECTDSIVVTEERSEEKTAITYSIKKND